MKNEQILENWHLQFKDQKKLNFEEAKELLKLASKETDELLKKQYYDKVILGTEHVIYEYLKNSKLYLLAISLIPSAKGVLLRNSGMKNINDFIRFLY